MHYFQACTEKLKALPLKLLQPFNALKLFLHELEGLVDAMSVTEPHSCLHLILS